MGKAQIHKRFVFAAGGSIVIAAIVLYVFAFSQRTNTTANPGALPSAVTSITQFTPYMFQVLDGFKINNASAVYAQGVLIFQLVSSNGQTIAVTEQLMPASVQAGIDPHATQLDGADGQAIITFHDTITSAALFGHVHHGTQTMVILNVTTPISQNTIEDLLRGLRAIR